MNPTPTQQADRSHRWHRLGGGLVLSVLVGMVAWASLVNTENAGNTVANPSFERHGAISPDSFTNFQSIPGWSSPDEVIQLHDGEHGGIRANSGETKLELDALSNTTVEQAFTTVSAKRYALDLYYTPRVSQPGTDTNDVQV